MISKAFIRILWSGPVLLVIDGARRWNSVVEKTIQKLPNNDPRSTAEARLDQVRLGTNSFRFETCWHKQDDDTPAKIRAIQGRCSRPPVNPESQRTVIEIPR